uniref:Phospholipid scramblase n=1 Tax=Seriola lalandi dorsalis TaxID=1841481 RepID=A0A3B4X114_SERLL
MYAVQIPDGVSAGQQFQVNVGGQLMSVPVPAGYGPGMTINVQAPPQVAPTPVMGAPVAPMQAVGPPMPVVAGVAITPDAAKEAYTNTAGDKVKLIDSATAGILATVDDFTIRQRVKFWEALSQGCFEQSNTYDVFDAHGNHLFIVQEQSDDCERCCCAPYHSLQARFKLVNSTQRVWKTRGEIETLPTAFTADRVGCCAKPCLGCFICTDDCKDGLWVHAGDAQVPTGTTFAPLEHTVGYATQPSCGAEGFEPLAKVEGPCCWGGCSELCFSSEFLVSTMGRETENRPRDCGSFAKEMFTDSDIFTMAFKPGHNLSPQQKATMMASLDPVPP